MRTAAAVAMPLQPETVQTILKCIGASTNAISPELSQEIFQMNLQASRLLSDKPNLQQQQQTPQPTKSIGNNANQGPYDMIQSMINLNMNTATGARFV